LRTFELLLLRDVGLLPDLAREGSTLANWTRRACTCWRPSTACAGRMATTATR
jgi:hypothetical protein